ncbi:MAG: DUF5721 family protein [Lachnospiraceae bacterium]|nr:DUF5721 family protein [Lachnospiraceae bacterium]
MIALTLPELKTAASCIFTKDTFDYFLVKEITISTSNTFHVDGKLHPDYFTDEEKEALRDPVYSDWKTLRPFCYQLIKGKKLPQSFRLVFQLSDSNVEKFLKQHNFSCQVSDIGGLYLHFRYENHTLSAISGTSLNFFSLDKTIDTAWDEMVKRILKLSGIFFEAG